MGCISSTKRAEDSLRNVFQVMNIDEVGNHLRSGELEITDEDVIFYQKGKTPIIWPLKTLRRYGYDSEHFSFESGRRCRTGPGIYAFHCKNAEQLFFLLQSRIQTFTNGEAETTDTSISTTPNLGMILSDRQSMYFENAVIRKSTGDGRFGFQNVAISRLCSVGSASASASIGPLSPQSITSSPVVLESVPLMLPPSPNPPPSQNLYANDEVISSVSQDLEETNNNKTPNEPVSPAFQHSYLNSSVLNSLPEEELTSATLDNQEMPEEVSNSVFDNNPMYMNVDHKTAVAALCPETQSEPSEIFVTTEESKPESPVSPFTNSENLESFPVNDEENSEAQFTKSLNYIVLDLEPSVELPKSPTTSLPLDIPKKLPPGYTSIDFEKTAALSQSVHPFYEIDKESCRRTRHSSTAKDIYYQVRQSSSVSE